MKKKLLYLMAVLYILAGINHFWHPDTYLKIIPPILPFHNLINAISGIMEIILGALLIPQLTRNLAAWGLIVLLIVVFPANIQMAINYNKTNHPHLWLAYLRLPLQLLLMWWAYLYTNRYLQNIVYNRV